MFHSRITLLGGIPAILETMTGNGQRRGLYAGTTTALSCAQHGITYNDGFNSDKRPSIHLVFGKESKGYELLCLVDWHCRDTSSGNAI